MAAKEYTPTCIMCGAQFSARRRHARFCSPKCKMAHHRGNPPIADSEKVTGKVTSQDSEKVTGKVTSQANEELEKERARLGKLMAETAEKRQFYEDLLNRKLAGLDYKKDFQVLKQALHPDRQEITKELRTKAIIIVKKLEKILTA